MDTFFRAFIPTPFGGLNALFLNGELIGMFENLQSEEKCLDKIKKEHDLVYKTDKELINTLNVQLDEYFKGKRFFFTIPISPTGTIFERAVYEKVMAVEYGECVLYKDIAQSLLTRAYRAVGSALKKNPIPFIIPCHRVVGKKNPDAYSLFSGAKTKQALLELEKRHKNKYSKSKIKKI